MPATRRSWHPDAHRVRSWLGSGEIGSADGVGAAAGFHEPSGLSVAGGRLYIADTNNRAVRVAETETGEVRTLEISGL